MRTLIGNYVFDKVNRKITFTDYSVIYIEKILLIVNVTNGVTIYQSNNPFKGGSVLGNVLTLDYDTNIASFADSDRLEILYQGDVETDGSQKTQLINSSGASIVSSAGNAAASVLTVQGIAGMTPVSANVDYSALPVGAATETKQDSQISILEAISEETTSLNFKAPDKGQALMSASVPVAIASNQSNVPVVHKGAVVSTANSTTIALDANAVFVGASEEVLDYGVISVVVRSNVSSAADGLQFLFSADNVNFYSSDEFTIEAGKFKTFTIGPVARYFKIQYTNGESAQTDFLLQTIYRQTYVKPSAHRLQDNPSTQDDAEVVTSILVAKQPDDNFTNIRTTYEGNLVTDFAQNQKDVFDRLITVQPLMIKSYDHRITKHPDDWNEVLTGSATSILNTTSVTVDMTTTSAAADSVVRQTYQQFQYTRGNTQQGVFSLNLNAGPKLNNNRYFGLGDGDNGTFIGVDGTGFYVMRRSKTSGSVVDTITRRSSFNVDRLDGTGLSKITLDLTKQNLFTISYSWLGTNAIVYAVTIGGKKYPFHIDNVGNTLTTAWCQSGQLPLRVVNQNTGAVGSSTTFKVGCTAVFTFGSSKGYEETQSVSSATTPITLSTVEKVCAGIRLRNGLKYVSIEPSAYQILGVSGTGNAYYKVIFRPTLTGATWANQGEISEILTNNPSYSGGQVLQEGYIGLASASRFTIAIPSTETSTLGYSINGVPDSLIIVIRTDTGNGSVYFAGSWKEQF